MLTDDIGGRKKDEDMGKYPINPYAISKSTAEGYVKVYNIIHGMQTVSLRYFNVFGSRQNPQGPYAAVVPIFIKNFFFNFNFFHDFTQFEILSPQESKVHQAAVRIPVRYIFRIEVSKIRCQKYNHKFYI